MTPTGGNVDDMGKYVKGNKFKIVHKTYICWQPSAKLVSERDYYMTILKKNVWNGGVYLSSNMNIVKIKRGITCVMLTKGAKQQPACKQ